MGRFPIRLILIRITAALLALSAPADSFARESVVAPGKAIQLFIPEPIPRNRSTSSLAPAVTKPGNVNGLSRSTALTPYPNLGVNTQNPQNIINNVGQIPPSQMIPNQIPPSISMPSPSPQAPGGNGGTGFQPSPNAGTNGGNSSGSQSPPRSVVNQPGPRTAISPGDEAPVSGTGSACHPPVKSNVSNELSEIPISANMNKLVGHNCGVPSNDRFVCMVCNLYYEADPRDYKGAIAIARSVMTRAMSSPYPDTVCGVVYQNNGRVAQYSWYFERKNHVLQNNEHLRQMVSAAIKGMDEGPNGFTNYYAQSLVYPSWAKSGGCHATLCTIGDQTFCAIGAKQNRSVKMYLADERIPMPSTHLAAVDQSNATH